MCRDTSSDRSDLAHLPARGLSACSTLANNSMRDFIRTMHIQILITRSSKNGSYKINDLILKKNIPRVRLTSAVITGGTTVTHAAAVKTRSKDVLEIYEKYPA